MRGTWIEKKKRKRVIKLILNFSDGCSEMGEPLGTVEKDGRNKRVQYAEGRRQVYIYRVHVKRKGYSLVQIKDKKEFARICAKLNTSIKM